MFTTNPNFMDSWIHGFMEEHGFVIAFLNVQECYNKFMFLPTTLPITEKSLLLQIKASYIGRKLIHWFTRS